MAGVLYLLLGQVDAAVCGLLATCIQSVYESGPGLPQRFALGSGARATHARQYEKGGHAEPSRERHAETVMTGRRMQKQI